VPDVETGSRAPVAPEGPPAAARAPGVAPTAPTNGVGAVIEELRDLYARTLGYPREAITASADLEADLGIDSLKRAEMLVKVTAHFRLPEAGTAHFVQHQTLSELADLVVTAQAAVA
jgi:acyl carrier protein